MQFQHCLTAMRVVRVMFKGAQPRPYIMIECQAKVPLVMEKGIIVTQPVKFPLVIQGNENMKAAEAYVKPGTELVVGFHLAACRYVASDCAFAPEALVLLCLNITHTSHGGSNARV